MLTCLVSAVMYSAACDDGHIGAFCYVKVIVHLVRKARGIYHHRDVHLLTVRVTVDVDVYARLVLFFHNLDVLAVPVTEGHAVVAQIESALLFKACFVYIFQYRLCYFIYFCHVHIPPTSLPAFSDTHSRTVPAS